MEISLHDKIQSLYPKRFNEKSKENLDSTDTYTPTSITFTGMKKSQVLSILILETSNAHQH